MKLLPLLFPLSLGAVVAFAAATLEFKAEPEWLKLPENRVKLGPQHGDVAVSSANEVYVSIMDPAAGVQVFSADGKFLRNVPNAPSDFHGFVIHKDPDGEHIYGAGLTSGHIFKMTLDGKVLLDIPPTAIPDEFKKKGKDGKAGVRLTATDVAPNGDLYITDGYSSDYVHRFDKDGKYIQSFGGKQPPYSFNTLHKIAIDTRFSPARIIGVDREGRRVVHMSLDGGFLGVVAKDMLRPAAVVIHGDYAIVGEILGRISVLDKEGNIVTQFGTNDKPEETANNKTEPAKWRPGIVTAPHGVACDAEGNVYVSEYSLFGRVHKFDKVK